MQRITIHISDDTRERIKFIAKAKSRTESEIIREALDEGLKILLSS